MAPAQASPTTTNTKPRSLAVPVSSGSPYDYAYRFSGDGGTTWVYCDGDAAGSSNGYALANAGQMTSTPGAPPNVWINEIHYDNASTDLDEGVEIAGPAGTDLTGFSVRAYNGSDGTSYLTSNLSGTIPNQMNGFGTVWVPIVGLQNGAPDGIALIGTANQVIQFLCYEGTFAATNGPAVGQTCTNIGVSQEPPTAIGLALQLTGTGGAYSAFTWAAASAHSRGLVNVGQTLQ